MVEIQNRIASEYAGRSADGELERLIWLPRDRVDAEPRQAAFIEQLYENPSAQLGADVIEDSLEEFKEILLEQLAPKEKLQEASALTKEPKREAPLVYLICDPADEEAVEPLEDYLFDQGFEVVTPGFDGNESDVAALHRQNLVMTQAALEAVTSRLGGN